MLNFLDSIRGLDTGAIALRMLLSCLCGAVIGLERSAKNRPAGFRTHILVCLASNIAALTGLYLYLELKIPSDISRISAQLITGLGFLGAGTIVVTKNLSVKGLTTAAGLWTTGIIGLAIGSGYYELGVIGTALVLITEFFFGKVSAKIHRPPEYTIEMAYDEKHSLENVLRLCKDQHMTIVNLRVHTLDLSVYDTAHYTATIALHGNVQSDDILRQVRLVPGVLSVALL